ncbi:MAG: HAD family hydrolase [Actinobacteria bacterium]|nr:HAD family hydrolase [Actinomycetota bacterium]
MPTRALVFDLDGTLIDSGPVVTATYAAVAREAGVNVNEATVLVRFAATPGAVIESLLGRPAIPADFDCYERNLKRRLDNVVVYEGVAAAVRALRASGVPTGIVTGAARRFAQLMLDHCGLEVALAVCGDEVAKAKPAPEGILRACNELGVRSGEVAYLGDAAIDMIAARRAGAVAVAAAWGHQFDGEVARLADAVLGSPAELEGLLHR